MLTTLKPRKSAQALGFYFMLCWPKERDHWESAQR